MPITAPAVTMPFAVARRLGAISPETTWAAPGCSGALQSPARLRTTSKQINRVYGDSVYQPATPVSIAKVPIVTPKIARARPDPMRSINQPPGSIASV